ncbi:MAG TPA: SDR family oxidoreductase [Candidatus Xenobia bacterium]
MSADIPDKIPDKIQARTALVTGGAVRVGRAIVERLRREGWRVAVHYHGSDPGEVGGVALQADVSIPEQVQRLCAEAIAALGGLDLLVNSAAIFGTAGWAGWERFRRINLEAPVLASLACAHALKARQGSIVNLVDTDLNRPGHLAYNVSKAALVAATRSLALDLAPDVRVNAIAPGAILPPTTGGPVNTSRIPLGHIGHPDDVAAAVLYLANAPFVTGQVLPVDGGRSLG